MKNESTQQVIVLIVAGGAGQRFGGETPKQFLPLADQPLLLRTVAPFQEAASIDGICLVVPEAFQDTVSAECQSAGFDKVAWIVAGGVERQDSTRAGFETIPACEIVLVHDGARPLVGVDLIEQVVAGARKKGACVPGVKVRETLKRVAAAGHVLTTVDREEYTTIQTPQGFRYPILAEALAGAAADGFCGTDESMLIERMGFPVCVVPGTADNIKVTTPEDLAVAAALLQERERGK